MGAREIKAKYPPGCKIINADGHTTFVRSSDIFMSPYRKVGTVILGGQVVYCSEKKVWATVLEIY
jgi:hypothetical protein